MKLLIITFQFAHNYGAMLQAYCLQEYLRKQGNEVSVLNYTPKHTKKLYDICPFYSSSSKDFAYKCMTYLKRRKQYYLFEKFKETKLNLTDKCICEGEIKKALCRYDAIVVGSDQVWNDDITNNDKIYFINIKGDIKKYSYAASFGKKRISDEIERCIRSFLPEFSAISVREKSGANIISNLIGRDVEVVLDPVFLFNKEEWSSQIGRSRYQGEKYILYYTLSDSKILKCKAEFLSKEKSISIYSIHPICKRQIITGKQLFNVGPIEFLDLVRNAEYIITDSFHAVAFSIIYRKKLIYYSYDQLNERVYNLLNIFLDSTLLLSTPVSVDLSQIIQTEIDNAVSSSKQYIRKYLIG